MALQLQATHAPDYVVQLADEPITLGRRREQGVSSTLVSREHVTVTASDATCAVVRALKRSFMTRAATAPEARPEILRPLDVTQMELGDCIYLAMERSQLKYGFMLQPALGNGQETDHQAKRARVDAPGSGAQQSPKYSAHLPHWHYQPAGGDQAGAQVAHQGYPPAGQHQQAGNYQPARGYQPGMPTTLQGYQPAAGAHHQQAEEYQPVGPGAEQGYPPAGEHQQELGGHAQQQGHPLYQQGAGGSQQQQGQEAGQAQEDLVQDLGLETGPTQESGLDETQPQHAQQGHCEQGQCAAAADLHPNLSGHWGGPGGAQLPGSTSAHHHPTGSHSHGASGGGQHHTSPGGGSGGLHSFYAAEQPPEEGGPQQGPQHQAAPMLSTGVGGGSVAGGRVLAGLHFVVWPISHGSVLIKRAEESGMVLEEAITPATSLVVASRNTRLPVVRKQLAKLSPQVPSVSRFYDGEQLQLPAQVQFVDPNFLAQCVARKKLLPPIDHPLQQPLEVVPVESTAGGQSPSSQGELTVFAPSERQQQQPAQAAGDSVAGPESPQPKQHRKTPARAAAPAAAAAGGAQEAAVVEGMRGMRGVYPDVDPVARRFTGGASGIPWGHDGILEEPWDWKSALRTVKILHAAWNNTLNSSKQRDLRQLKRKRSAQDDAGPSQAQPDTDDEAEPEEAAADSLVAGDSGALEAEVGTTGSQCAHVCCQELNVCICKELELVRAIYSGQGTDQFKAKAIDRAILELSELKEPLSSADQVDSRLGMGAKTKAKVKEIITTGSYRRNDYMANSERQSALRLFQRIFGAGEAVSQKWYNDGCRSLVDVRCRSDLTEQQLVGLQYYQEIEQPIPRGQAEEVLGRVQQTLVDVLPRLGCRDVAEADVLLAGSYRRGKPRTGDIDILVIMPPSAQPDPEGVADLTCGELLEALLGSLLAQGLLCNELSPDKAQPRHQDSVTWLGLCRVQGSECRRRIDVKVYPRRQRVFAINHFTGSGPFERALRFWARSHTKAQAQKLNPAADAFRLNDMALVPIKRLRNSRTSNYKYQHEQEFLEPHVEATCETDIFEALGLAYVPPFLRYFNSNWQ